MTKPRASSTQVDRFASVLADYSARLLGLERVAHSHDAQASVLLPAGSILETLWTSDPFGFLLLDGRTIVGGEFIYPALWSVAPVGWKSGSDIVLPTDAGKMVRAF
jgi:hypothetical protein